MLTEKELKLELKATKKHYKEQLTRVIAASKRRRIDTLESEVMYLLALRHDISAYECILDTPYEDCFGKV